MTSENQRQAYQYARSRHATATESHLADALRNALARVLEMEFWLGHSPWKLACGGTRREPGVGTLLVECTRPEHDWVIADWQSAAHNLLIAKCKERE